MNNLMDELEGLSSKLHFILKGRLPIWFIFQLNAKLGWDGK